MNPSADPAEDPEPYGQYSQNLITTSGFGPYDNTAWSEGVPQDQGAIYAQSYPDFPQNQEPSNATANAGWTNYAPDNGSQSFNYFAGQNDYGFTNIPQQGVSNANTIPNTYFESPNYISASQQHTVIAPRQLHNVPANGSYTSERTLGVPAKNSAVDGASSKAEVSKKHERQSPVSFSSTVPPASHISDAAAIVESLPKQKIGGDFFSVRDFGSLAENQMFTPVKSAPFATLSFSPTDVDAKKGTIPAYKKRESSEGLRKFWHQQNSGQAKDSTASGPPLKKPKLATEKLSRSRKETSTTIKQKPSVVSQQSASPDTSGESSDEEDSNVDTPHEEMNVEEYLPPERPDDPEGAVKYDTIKALWLTAYRIASAEEISASLKSFWDVMSGLRDQISALQSEIKDLEPKGTSNELRVKKTKLEQARSLVDIAVETALKRGHPQNLEHLGEVHLIMLSLREALVARLAEKNFNSRSVKAILELMSKCKTVTEELSAKLKLSKVFDRYKKAGDDEVKGLLDTISMNVTNATKRQKEKEKTSSDKTYDGASPPKLPNRMPTASTNPKRPREEDIKDGANKRPTPASGISSSGQPPKGDGNVLDARSVVGASKSRPTPPTKTSGFFKDLQSASKVAAKATPQASMLKRPQAKPTAPSTTPVEQRQTSKAPAPTPARAVFSFSETMANLNKPKEPVASPAPTPAAPPETEEEKRKRLRKEERRKMRVRFREEGTLVQVRFYVPEKEEKSKGGDDAVKDVRDQSQEGQALKRHLNAEDEEDDSESLRNHEPLQEWDFSSLSDSRRKKNITTRGGEVPIHSEELDIQRQKEAETLMVVYMSPNIPPSPREPPQSDTLADQKSTIEFGEPSSLTKDRELAIEAPGLPYNQNQAISVNDKDLESVLSSLIPRQGQPQSFHPAQPEKVDQKSWWFEQKPDQRQSSLTMAQQYQSAEIISIFEDYVKIHPTDEYVKNHPRPWLIVHTPPPSPQPQADSSHLNGTGMDVDDLSNVVARAQSSQFQAPSLPFDITPMGEEPSCEYRYVLDTMKIDKIVRDAQAKPGANETEAAQAIAGAIQVFGNNPVSKSALEMYIYNNSQPPQTAPDTNGISSNQSAYATPNFDNLKSQSAQAVPPLFGHSNQDVQAALATYGLKNSPNTQGVSAISNYGHQHQQQSNDDHNSESSNRHKDDWRHDNSEAARRSREAHNESKKFTAPCKYYKQGRCLKGAKCTYLH